MCIYTHGYTNSVKVFVFSSFRQFAYNGKTKQNHQARLNTQALREHRPWLHHLLK